MTYENIKTGVFRLFVLVNIFLVIAVIAVDQGDPDAIIGIIGSTIILWSIYFLGLWIINGFIGKK